MRCELPLSLSWLSFASVLVRNNCSAFTLRLHPSSVDNGSRRTSCALLRPETTTVMEPATLNDISVTLPHDWKYSNPASWSKEAAAILSEHGAVALVSKTDNNNDNDDDDGLIKNEICDNANQSAYSRVKEMHHRIASSRGLDPKGVEEPYRFAEIICRDDGGRRYDVPIPWLGGENEKQHINNGHIILPTAGVGSGRIGAPLLPKEEEAIAELHSSMGRITTSVMNALWSNNDDDDSNSESSSYVAAAGFLMNEPGSNSQNWHRDGPDEGFIDCFVPLIDLNESVGPTAIQPGTHRTTCSVVGDNNDNEGGNVLVPLLNKGDVLLFDYRTIHRGLGNVSESTTRTLAYAVYRRKEESSANDVGDIHNFPAALTLEYD